MKNINSMLVSFVLWLSIGVATADAFIVLDDAQLVGDHWSGYSLYLSQSIPPGGGAFQIILTYSDSENISIRYSTIAEAYAVYAATIGMAFTPEYAHNNTYLMSNMNNPGSATINVPINGSVYLGYWDDRNWDQIPTEQDLYGWIQLENTEEGLGIMDGATAVGGGIVIGTYAQIPEPGTAGLLLLGAAALMRRRRRS